MTSTAAAGISAEGATGALVASVQNLSIHFKTKAGMVHAVDDVSFDIRDGETLGLVGETGCGKSVTARSFMRLVASPPGVYAGGKIDFWSSEARAAGGGPVNLLTIADDEMLEIRGNRIAMIFQDPGKALNPALSIGNQLAEVFFQHRSDELLEPLGPNAPVIIRRAANQESGKVERVLLKLPPLRSKAAKVRQEVEDHVAAALAETQIANPRKIMDRYPHELSGGMKQRVLIAQALACNPDLLIADEPTTALDVTIQAKILKLIGELQQRRRTSVLYISHDLSLVREISDRVAVMYAGRIAEIGRTDDVFRQPLHPYTRSLMAAVPSSRNKRGELAAIEGNVPELIDPQPSCRFHTRCPYAAEVCGEVDPRFLRHDFEHGVACHIYDEPAELGIRPDELPTYERRTR
ncbi:MAG: ABC transporter ATP-binding protein [Acidimicrobiia bacterium]